MMLVKKLQTVFELMFANMPFATIRIVQVVN